MSALRQEIRDGIATVTLDRPEKRNAFDDAIIDELIATFHGVAGNETIRAVVLASTGPVFSAGADLAWMQRMAGYGEAENLADARRLAEMLRTLDELPQPTIARVHGAAFGGAVGLIACCDIAVATDAAKFSLSEVRLGIMPSTIGPYVMRAIGPRAARRYFQTAELFDAREAHRLGLVSEVVEPGALDDAVDRIIGAVRKGGPHAQRAAKKLIRDLGGRPVDAGLIEETAQRIAKLRATDEAKGGFAAFLEKRKPPWA